MNVGYTKQNNNTLPKKGADTAVNTKPINKVVKNKEITLSSKATVIIGEEVNDKIKHACRLVNNVEWSGLLLYTIEGSTENPETLVCTIRDIYLMDIGTSAHTQFSYDSFEIAEAYSNNEQWILGNYRLGLIHSHVNMGVFFSGEDMSELHDNSVGTDFYLSVIVNNANSIIAKIGIAGKRVAKGTIINTFKSSKGTPLEVIEEISNEEDVLFIIDCTIQKPMQEIPQFEEIVKRVGYLEDKKKAAEKVKTSTKASTWYKDDYYKYWDEDYPQRGNVKHIPTTSVKSSYTPPKSNYMVERFLSTTFSKLFSDIGCKYTSLVEENLRIVERALFSTKSEIDFTYATILERILGYEGIKSIYEDHPVKEIYENLFSKDVLLSIEEYIKFMEDVVEYLEDIFSKNNTSMINSLNAFLEAFEHLCLLDMFLEDEDDNELNQTKEDEYRNN